MRIALLLEIKGLTEDQLQKELAVFFKQLEAYDGFGATATGLTKKGYQNVKNIIEETSL
ncbi:hypothetical protein HCJ46_11685 [Listeria booriae]|uniref:hypothetical protein n=1 Tax=Listeria booriae TaxID=1552123 RepID=UPI001624B851|nr:hypothetical protein [Listeria booriae]MBC1919403.1 hypothetical protein [Listeria booriae]